MASNFEQFQVGVHKSQMYIWS